jgi:superfamily I DNA/RNA helicase
MNTVKLAKEAVLLNMYRNRKKGKRRCYAAVSSSERNDDEPPERLKIQELIEELRKRGYDYKDIAVLTQTNEDAVERHYSA